jgi:hypothetical protein
VSLTVSVGMWETMQSSLEDSRDLVRYERRG